MQNKETYIHQLKKIIPAKKLSWWAKEKPEVIKGLNRSIVKFPEKSLDFRNK